MDVVTEERALRQRAKGNSRQLESRLVEALKTATPTKPAKTPKMALHDKFDGTRAKAETFASQVNLHFMGNLEAFDNDRSKLVFTLTHLTGQASSWAMPFTRMLAAKEELTNDQFWESFSGMYFDSKKKTNAEKALRLLKQTKSVAHYTHAFTVHAYGSGWEVPTLISHYRQGLKKEVRMAIVLARATFETLESVSKLALQIDNELNGAEAATTTSNHPVADPNAMDLSAFRGQLSEPEKLAMMRNGQCFRCGVKGHCVSFVNATSNHNPCVFITSQIIPTNSFRATPTIPTLPPRFLIDSGATHNVLSLRYAEAAGLLESTTLSERVITGFNGSKSRATYDIQLSTADNPTPLTFIITKLKDTCDGILGMPWLRDHGQRVNWEKGLVRDSNPSRPATKQEERTGALSEGGRRTEVSPTSAVCTAGLDTSNVLATIPSATEVCQVDHNLSYRPHREAKTIALATHPPHRQLANETPVDDAGPEIAVKKEDRMARQPASNNSSRPEITVDGNDRVKGIQPWGKEHKTARTSWSTSARIAVEAKRAANTPKLEIEQVVPRCYHRHLNMFRKKEAQTLPPRQKYDFRVELTPGATPQASRIIPLSPAENTALETLVEEGLSNGTIRRMMSPWAAPVFFTGKKDGNLRPCFDYRKLNAVTVKNKYPLLLTMDLVDSLLDANRFTKLDLRNAYGNLRVAEGNEDKLAFICKAGQFAPLTMPFGPTGAPGYFQYFIQDIFVGRIGRNAAAYLDDILVYTQAEEDHEAAVGSILDTLSRHHLWLKPEKCEFSKEEVKYLGLLISRIGYGWTRGKYHFSGTARPLHDLTKKTTEYVWDTRCQEAFDALKLAFTTAPVLKIANPYKGFILECDCSDFALGAILSQVCETDSELHPVVFLSRSLIQAERNYQIFDKELLAIVASFKEWRHYLEGNPHRLKAIVYTDHRNLESFMTTKELTRRQARWAETMGCFDFDIVFRPGRQSTKPDALSRQPDLAPAKGDKLTFGQLLHPKNITPDTFTEVAEVAEFESWFQGEEIEAEEVDQWFHIDVMGAETEEGEKGRIRTDLELLDRVRELSKENDWKEGSRHSYKEGIWYDGDRVVVPNDPHLRREITRSRHDSKLAGHPGRARTLALVRRCFTWRTVRRFVNTYVDGCDSCQRVKPVTQQPFGTLEPMPIPAGPWTDISYDLITDLPESDSYNCILTVVDRLTKMSHFIPCRKDLSASGLADLMLRHVWKLHGTPKTIVSDRGSIFISQITEELDKKLGIRLHPSTAYHPRTDGQSEIVNKAVEQYIRHFVGYHQDDWEQLLPTAEFAYNNNQHSATGVSPFKGNYGYDPIYGGIPSSDQCIPEVGGRLKAVKEVQEELKFCLEEAQETMRRQFNKTVRTTPKWKEGDMVWLNSKHISTTRPSAKFEHRWLGPFPIQSQISTSAYKLILPLSMKGVDPVFHVSVLRKQQPDLIQGRRQEEPKAVEVKGVEEWEVEEYWTAEGREGRRDTLLAGRGTGRRRIHGSRNQT
ncbi:hypothetical protein PSHT_05141 [Puccinia striiformis]|uniref:Uncharacterized protein n=1 Tax=Puccinia striiformis TaxID=27350 RepID=A0A2S4WB68_9BASI|nr:hypothetical protein PSHT_05141 [Puccinia striiformis]